MFCGDNHSFNYTPTNVSNINSINIYNGVFDELYVTKNTNIEFIESSKFWDFSTILYAQFQGTLDRKSVV